MSDFITATSGKNRTHKRDIEAARARGVRVDKPRPSHARRTERREQAAERREIRATLTDAEQIAKLTAAGIGFPVGPGTGTF